MFILNHSYLSVVLLRSDIFLQVAAGPACQASVQESFHTLTS